MVYIVDAGRVVKRRVTLGKVLGDRVVVLEGIASGDPIVQVGAGRLEDGDRVSLLKE